MTTKRLFDPVEVTRAIQVLTEPGQVFEIRALKAITPAAKNFRATYSGYFNDVAPVLKALAMLLSAEGIYITLNTCHPDLLHRAKNKLLKVDTNYSTSDSNILRYRWLLIDSDPVRVAGISSTDQQHALALSHSRMIRDALRAEGWPEPIVGDSGNGAHLLYRIDLPNEEETSRKGTGLLARVLAGLAQRFDTDAIKVDQTVFNPSRICKLYGTLACKGDDTEERPHRVSRLLEVTSCK
jgi:hypothetical protein